ncbi:MAG: prefoldin subunit alpha [Halalkalicoccus sp.]
MSMGGGNPELQELSQQLQELDAQQEALETEIEALETEQAEITEAVDALESLETDSTVQVPVGGGAYVRATVDDIDEVVVNVGGGFAAELERDDATSTLQTKRNTLSDRIDEVEAEIDELESEIDEVEQRAQQVQQQAQQQAMQQLQQQQGNDEQ